MKVKVSEKPFLAEGKHIVTITEIEEGKSENKGIPFFNCRLENEEGFVNQRFYLSEPGQPILAAFMQAAGIEKDEFDTKELKGKSLAIEVEERTYEDASGKEKTIKQAINFTATGKAETSKSF